MIAQVNPHSDRGIGKRGRWSWSVISEKGGMWGPFKTKERAMLTLARVRKYFAHGGSWYREEGGLVVGQVRRSPTGWEYAIPGAEYVTYHADKAWKMISRKISARGSMSAMKNAAAGAEKVVIAFLEGRKAREGRRPDYMAGARYETDGQSLVQWGSVIARKVNGSIEITDAGWRTKTTMAMLNSVLRRVAANADIYQKKHEWFLSTPDGAKPWRGKAVIKLDGGSVTGNGKGRRRWSPISMSGPIMERAGSSGKRTYKGVISLPSARSGRASAQSYAMRRIEAGENPLTRKEAGRIIREGRQALDLARQKEVGAPSRAYWRGRAVGAVRAVEYYGPKVARRAAGKLEDRANAARNPLNCFKNLHTKAEQARAKKLIDSYYTKGKAALHAGKVAVAAHCYGAIAAIRQIARGERPVPQTVVNVASFRLDLLRQLRRDLTRMRGGSGSGQGQTASALARWRAGMGR